MCCSAVKCFLTNKIDIDKKIYNVFHSIKYMFINSACTSLSLMLNDIGAKMTQKRAPSATVIRQNVSALFSKCESY